LNLTETQILVLGYLKSPFLACSDVILKFALMIKDIPGLVGAEKVVQLN